MKVAIPAIESSCVIARPDLTPNKLRFTIKDLYPDLIFKQRREAEENLDRYLEVVLRIYDRIPSHYPARLLKEGGRPKAAG